MTNRSHSFSVNIGIALGAMLIATGAPTLTRADEPAATATQPASAASIDEAKLDKFVAAYSDVLQIQKEAAQKQSSIKEADAAKALADETQTKMLTAVKQSGLEVDEFNEISQLMLQDADLRSRVAAKMQVRDTSGG
jgi:Domain of unknown function (DUF4168)